MPNRKAYPSDISDEEWTFVAPYLALVREDAPQREHDQREVFNGLCWVVLTSLPDRGYAAFWHPFIAHLYSTPQHLVIVLRRRTGFSAVLRSCRTGSMQDPGYGLRRIPLLRGWVNKATMEGRSVVLRPSMVVALPVGLLAPSLSYLAYGAASSCLRSAPLAALIAFTVFVRRSMSAGSALLALLRSW